jgi:hypothetical protein
LAVSGQEVGAKEIEARLQKLRDEHDVLVGVYTREPVNVVWRLAPLLSETDKTSEDSRLLVKVSERRRRDTVVDAATDPSDTTVLRFGQSR